MKEIFILYLYIYKVEYFTFKIFFYLQYFCLINVYFGFYQNYILFICLEY